MSNGLVMKYFVLRPKAKQKDDVSAAASQDAMLTYADTIQDFNPKLAQEIREWASKEAAAQVHLDEPDNSRCGCGYCDS